MHIIRRYANQPQSKQQQQKKTHKKQVSIVSTTKTKVELREISPHNDLEAGDAIVFFFWCIIISVVVYELYDQ